MGWELEDLAELADHDGGSYPGGGELGMMGRRILFGSAIQGGFGKGP